MSPPCSQCGGATAWDDDAASAICMTCGTLVDASQSVFTDGYEMDPATMTWEAPDTSNFTLKSLRNPNWSLAGQGKEVRENQNAFQMKEFIASLTTALQVPSGLAPRASTLFTQAMKLGNFRWGRKAKLVAGACLSIALRESKRPDFRHDIALLLDEKPNHMTRILSTVLSTLRISLTASDPSFYLPSLQVHLSTALRCESGDTAGLPLPLITALKPLNMLSVLSMAHALSDLLARSASFGPKSSMQGSAAAILMLSLEGQARTNLAGLGELAEFLAEKCKVGKGLIMKRYKAIQDELVAMMSEISWLDQYEKKKNGRGKVAKRLLVARGLPDVLVWGTETRRANFKTPTFMEEEEQDEGSNHGYGSETASSHSSVVRTSPTSVHRRPQKKQKLCATLSEASKFLLDPLSSSLPTTPSNTSASTRAVPMTSYLLAAPTSALTSKSKPTRLQILSVAKNGEEVLDDELFEDGELDGFLRSEDEVRTMSLLWEHKHPASEERPPPDPKPVRKRKRRPDEPKEPSRRLNHDALTSSCKVSMGRLTRRWRITP
ncbi:hypothetical protein BDZ89DRAFT_976025 [Hymenopellis radicata]|nr:hypothetical protein BDZ89DRAFT_976025 [Hymenopellis radicata]